MDRAFLSYYEDELSHIREMAGEFSALHPTIARNLSLDSVPCPDPYVERLLEGVAFLAARTRLKVDAESSRYVRSLLDALYPDLVAPAPAMSLVQLDPGDQVESMEDGYVVPRGTRMNSGLRDGLTTRATFTTAQDVQLLPIRIASADYLQDIGALRAAGFGDRLPHGQHVAGIRLVVQSASGLPLSSIALDQLDLFLGHQARGGALFDAIHGHGTQLMVRADRTSFGPAGEIKMIGVSGNDSLLPELADGFQGYGLLREYFLMPERFHFARLTGLSSAAAAAKEQIEVVILLGRSQPELSDIAAKDFQLFVTPIVNLFERECNIVELARGRADHVVHADRTRPVDFEIFRLLRVEDVEDDGPSAQIASAFTATADQGARLTYATQRRTRRPGAEEIRRGQMRTSYAGDDLFISLSRAGAGRHRNVRRLDIRALVSNRDLCILDDTPTLTLDSGAPVGKVTLLQALKRPRASLQPVSPNAGGAGDRRDELAWRWVSQLSLNHLSLGDELADAEALRALLSLYSDRGDPALARHAQALQRSSAKAIFERLPIAGPICFGQGTEVHLEIDEAVLSGHSRFLLSGLLAQLFRRHAAVNAFVRTRTTLVGSQEDVTWPLMLGNRAMI